MVDENLPVTEKDRPLRWLFLDLNSYFASCEQQQDPSLRGKPIAVVPVEADTTCVIAASYEAKRFGIKTGTLVGEAKRLCPDLICVHGRHTLYTHFHEKILEVAESVLPVDKVCSIDEMRFCLIGKERDPGQAREIGVQMKKAIREGVGEAMTCSVGIAPNAFLAKLGTDMQKPDGLVILQVDDIPGRLLDLKLTDFCGINRRMQARLQGAGIFTVQQLYAADAKSLRLAFGSIMGEKWWYLIRGFELKDEESEQKSLGHSHILPPDLRTDQGCKEVLLRLVSKAAARLRANDLWAGTMGLHVSGFKKSWKDFRRTSPCQDTMTFNDLFFDMWPSRNFVQPRGVGVVFGDLRSVGEVTLNLFDKSQERARLSRALDSMNQKFGKNTVFLAGMEQAKDTAEERIAFNKTWLFSEGKGDNIWEVADQESSDG